MNLKIQTRAGQLPEEWDVLAGDNPYLKRNFLSFIEQTEREYRPRYYLFYEGTRADSCFVAYRNRKFDIGMFTPKRIYRPVTMIYLPMCVTRAGIVLGSLREEVLQTIRKMRGYTLVLNAPEENAPEFSTGLTCPKCILRVEWDSFDGYVSALRSDYRNRLKKTFARTQEVTIRFIDNKTQFTRQLYELYLNVLNRSQTRIETLSPDYFRGEKFCIFVAEKGGRPVGFVQLLENGKELIFEFVGMDYSANADGALYHRMLYEIIRYGTEHGFESIDFGQTADESKLKLGCAYTYLYAWLHHSSPLVNFFCKRAAPVLAWHSSGKTYRVFKGDRE